MTDEDGLLGNEALEAEEIDTPASDEDEQSSNPEEYEADAEEDDSDETEGDADPDAEDGDESEDDEEASEFEEVEYQGKKYKLHPDLKPALMMNADYTRKTQEVAEQRRTLEEKEQSLTQQVETHQALVNEYGKLQALQMQIEQYKDVDWGRLDQEDPIAAGQHFRNLQQLKESAQQVAYDIHQKQEARSNEAQRAAAKREEDYQRALATEFTDWTPELNFQLTNYARSQGLTDEDISSVRDVRMVKILREAMEGRQLKEKLRKQQAAAKKPKPKADVKPLKKQAQGRTSARTGLADDMPIDDWVKLRRKQEAAKSRY